MILAVRVAFLVALCGCDAVFGLHGGATSDAAPDGDTRDAADLGPCPAHPHAVYVAPGDLDGDGEDNCHDPCPLDNTITSATPGLVDTDGDGTPDPCDPNAAGGGTAFPDCLVLLDQFNDNNHPNPLDPRWKSNSATGALWDWKVCPAGNKLGFCSPPSVVTSVVYFDQALPDVTFVVADAAEYNSTGTFSLFDVFADAAPDGTTLDGRACQFFTQINTTSGAQLEDITGNTAIPVAMVSKTKTYTDGDHLQLIYQPLQRSSCQEVDFVDATATSDTPPPAKLQRIGVRVDNVDLELHSIVAYASSAACK